MRLDDTMTSTGHQTEPRPVAIEVCLLSRPDGSAQVSHGDTCVLSAVYGPGEVKISKEHLDKSTIDVVYKPKEGQPSCADRTPENLVGQVCDSIILSTLHPRSAITVVVQEMQNSGSYLSCCINAACMALLDAAVPLKHTVAAVSCCYDSDGTFYIDPTAAQEKCATAILTFAFDSKTQGVVLASCHGNYTTENYEKALHACRQATKNLFLLQRDALQNKLSKTV